MQKLYPKIPMNPFWRYSRPDYAVIPSFFPKELPASFQCMISILSITTVQWSRK